MGSCFKTEILPRLPRLQTFVPPARLGARARVTWAPAPSFASSPVVPASHSCSGPPACPGHAPRPRSDRLFVPSPSPDLCPPPSCFSSKALLFGEARGAPLPQARLTGLPSASHHRLFLLGGGGARLGCVSLAPSGRGGPASPKNCLYPKMGPVGGREIPELKDS